MFLKGSIIRTSKKLLIGIAGLAVVGSLAIAAPASAGIGDLVPMNTYSASLSTWPGGVDVGGAGYALATWHNTAPAGGTTVSGYTVTATAPTNTTFNPTGVIKQRYNNVNNSGTTTTWGVLSDYAVSSYCTLSAGNTKISCTTPAPVITPGEYRQIALPVIAFTSAPKNTLLHGDATITAQGVSVRANLTAHTTNVATGGLIPRNDYPAAVNSWPFGVDVGGAGFARATWQNTEPVGGPALTGYTITANAPTNTTFDPAGVVMQRHSNANYSGASSWTLLPNYAVSTYCTLSDGNTKISCTLPNAAITPGEFRQIALPVLAFTTAPKNTLLHGDATITAQSVPVRSNLTAHTTNVATGGLVPRNEYPAGVNSWLGGVDVGGSGFARATWQNTEPVGGPAVTGFTITATAPANTTFDPAGVTKQQYSNDNYSGTSSWKPLAGYTVSEYCTLSEGNTKISCTKSDSSITPGEFRMIAFPVIASTTAPTNTLLHGDATITTQGVPVTADLTAHTTDVVVAVKPAPPVFTNVDNSTGTTVINGTGVPGATVTVRDSEGATIGTGTVRPDGTFSVPLDKNHADDPTDLSMTQTVSDLESDPTTISAADLPIIDPTVALGVGGAAAIALLIGGFVLRRQRARA